MTGNEAIARGAFEGGVTVGAAYPGTPSTEILENLALYAGIDCNWSPNEKTALEAAIGASMEGARVLAAMKHVGVNVAADPLLTLSYTGVGGGLVLVSADDPGMHSSQNEQDNRHYARFAKIPLLEPADSEEARDYVISALEMSEKFDTPVLLRTTTRISHSRGTLLPGEKQKHEIKGFKKDPAKYVMLPGFARLRHPIVEERLLALQEEAETSPLNRIEPGSKEIGVLCSGVVYQYAREALPHATFLKLGFSHPLPKKLVRRFASMVKEIIVIEELDPFFEEQLLAMHLDVPVRGKELFGLLGEIGAEIIREKVLGEKAEPIEVRADIPGRPPVMCPGCSHRGLFHTLKKLKLNVMGDIGCYTLGALPPLEAIDACVCMGASIGLALGMVRANPAAAEKTVAVIGDSTFLHSGITPLLDAVYNSAPITVLILDNSITAMTGHQEHPGTGTTLQGIASPVVDLENICRAVGVKRVTTVDAFDLETLKATIKEELAAKETSVVIVRRPCVFLLTSFDQPLLVDQELCTGCGTCIKLGCPALSLKDEKARINSTICTACGLCEQLCRFEAIKPAAEKAGE
ncbi:MAG: indolepyruvate ferredoxin oxidoreductase subunit alpha [Dethiobacteria bacterium]|nr:indolepyruvate ferredoxin oxidoreductase subunit alpha [Dethiobacteria bacterium]